MSRQRSADLEGVDPIGMTEAAGLSAVQEAGLPEIVLEDDFEEIGRNYLCDELELSLWIDGGLITALTLFPEYDEAGKNPIWPVRAT